MNAVSTYECNSRAVHLSDKTDSAPYTIHGVALGAGDVTTGASGLEKMWPADELRAAADTLEGTNLVEDHENSAKGVVGAVTKAGYEDGVGVIYEAELYDDELASKIRDGLLEVSIRGFHKDVDDLERDGSNGALVVEDIEFDNLSIVPTGASPSNTLNMGKHDELSAEELSEFTESLASSVEAGDYVTWDDGHGIVFSAEDGEATVEMMEEVDGMWRAVGEQQTVDEDSLEMWDVDEEDIGAPKDSDEMMEDVNVPMPGAAQLLYPEEEMAEEVSEMMGISGSHTHDLDGSEWYMPGESHEAFEDAMGQSSDSMAMDGMQQGSWVLFTNFDGEEMYGRITSVSDEDPSVATIQIYSEDGEEMDETVERPLQVLKPWDAPVEESVSAVEEGAVYVSTLNDGKYIISDVAADRVKVSKQSLDKGAGWWERMSDIRRKLREGVWMRVGDGDSGEQSYYGEDEEEMAADAEYSQGDWVEWDTRNSTEIGKVVGSYTAGDDIPTIRGNRNLSPEEGEVLYTLRMYKQRDGTWHPIEGNPIGHYEDSVRSTDEPSDVSDSPVELTTVGELAQYSEGDLVMWEWGDGEAHGRVNNVYTDEGQEITRTIDGSEITRTVEEDRPVYELDVWRESDEEFSGTALKYEDKLNAWSDAPDAVEEMMAPDWREGQMVKWQVNPDMFGKIVHVDDEKDIVMVEVHERTEGGPESTGFTVTAGYSDLRPMNGYGDGHSMDEMADADLDDVYEEWNEHVNMTADELRRWSENPCSREASMEPVAVLKRNLRLLERDKDEWTDNDIEDAQRTISFISRMSDSENEPDEPKNGPHGCPSEWAISLLNWAHNPFDSMPDHPDNDDLDEVDAVELSEATLMDYSMHEVTHDGSHDNEWNRPDLEDFAEEYDFEAETDFNELDEDARQAVSEHFIISADGFPPEDYGDLKLPVVEPDGRLSLNALAAVKGGRGVSAVDGLTDDMEQQIVEYVNGLADDVFDAGWSDEEEMMAVTVLTSDDLQNGEIGASKIGPIFTNTSD